MPSDAVSLVQTPTTLPSDASPRQVVESILAALTDAQTARATGLGTPEKKNAYDVALTRIFALAAKSDIHQQMLGKSSTVPKNVTPDAAMTVIAESWISQIAHYTGGFKLDSLRLFPETPQTDATATIEAVAPIDREALTRIESALTANPPKKPDGTPMPPGSTEYTAAIRQAAINAGFNVPVTAAIDVRLRKVDGAWRVTRITLGQGGRIPRSLTCSPKLDPVLMRVFTDRMGEEILDETKATNLPRLVDAFRRYVQHRAAQHHDGGESHVGRTDASVRPSSA